MKNKPVAAIIQKAEDHEATRIGKLYAKGEKSEVDSLRYYLECGEMLIAKKSTLKHGQWGTWLKQNEKTLGFVSRTAQMLMAQAAKTQPASHLTPDQAREISREMWGHSVAAETPKTKNGKERIVFASPKKLMDAPSLMDAPEPLPNSSADGQSTKTRPKGNPEFYTPESEVEIIRSVLGSIDLDPASSEKAQETVKATKYYTQEDDGLKQPWIGNVFLNPPYDKIDHFVDKLIRDYLSGNIKQAILLTSNGNSSDWWQKSDAYAKAIFLPDDRVKFLKFGNPSWKSSPQTSQTFFYFGSDPSKFVAAYGGKGALYIHDPKTHIKNSRFS